MPADDLVPGRRPQSICDFTSDPRDEPDVEESRDQAKLAKCLLRCHFRFASFRVSAGPLAPSRAMDARWKSAFKVLFGT
jgi:hypothetical protein